MSLKIIIIAIIHQPATATPGFGIPWLLNDRGMCQRMKNFILLPQVWYYIILLQLYSKLIIYNISQEP